ARGRGLLRRLAALLGRHARRPSLAALQATLPAQRYSGRILSSVRVELRHIAGRLVYELLRKLVHVTAALARAVRHTPSVACSLHMPKPSHGNGSWWACSWSVSSGTPRPSTGQSMSLGTSGSRWRLPR